MSVRFTPAARAQFLSGLDYIRGDSPSAARKLLARSKKALRRLETHPHSGRRLPEFPDLPYREVVVRPYRFFYRVADGVVWVVAVWHGAQLPGLPPR